jgi:putative ABC transport system permease protein
MWPFRRRSDDDFRREIEAHVSIEADRLTAEGMTPDEARHASRRSFGNITRVAERFYESRRALWFDEMRQDVRYAVRALWRSPGFAAVAILTLALGIGANTAIFSVVNAVVLRPLPYRDPASLVLIDVSPTLSAPSWLTSSWRDRARTLSHMAGFNGPRAATLNAGGEPEQVQSALITWNFLSLLGVAPAVGRDFTEADASPGAIPVALLSHALWITRFGGDASIIGRTVRVSGDAITVVGVTPATFRFSATGGLTPVSVPLDTQPDVMRVAGPTTQLKVIGRLAPGIPAPAATQELLAIYKQAAASLLDDGKREYSQSEIDRLQLEAGLLQERLAGNVRERLWLAMGAVGFVLLVACANVANLLLARASTRHRELAVRTALGARRGRLVRLLLTESVLLALIGSVLGLLLAVSTSGVARMVLAERLPHIDRIAVDWWVLAFTVAVAAVTGMLCGLASIPGATRVSLTGIFSGGTPAVTGRSTMRRILLSTEVAMTFVLVVGAALLVQTLWNLSTKNRGFEADRLLTVRVSPGAPRDLDRRDATVRRRYFAVFFSDLRDRLERMPGVASAGAVSLAPLAGTASRLANIAVDGRGHVADESSTPIAFVTPGYLRTMRIPVIAGRDFDERDRLGAERVVIVNEAFQRRFVPDGNIVGARITAITEGFTVIGLTEDVPDRSLREVPEPLVMAPLAQMPAGNITWQALTFVLRTAGGDPLRLAPAVRREVWAIDPNIVISEMATMDERVALTIRTERDSALLFGLFAVAALVMAAIGVYGVAAYAIAQRTKEIGIRIALGAARRDISRLVVSQTLVPTMIGVAIGVAGAAIAAKLVASMVYGLTPMDPATFAMAAVMLISVALIATWLPARRATRTDPLIALRSQ